MKATPKIIGVLALQGSFKEHMESLRKCGAHPIEVRTLEDTTNLEGVIVPGGESTTLMKLMQKTGLDLWLKKAAQKGLPIYGTCAGMIILDRAHLNLMDIEVDRNAYGRQVASFQDEIKLWDGTKFEGIFIRAPRIKSVGKKVEVLGRHEKDPVLLRQQNLLAGSFHPELTEDLKIHQFFLSF